MELQVDRDRCVGAGQCVLSAPAVFDQDDDGIVTVLAPPESESEVRDAVQTCPSGALSVND
ncbi:ferredoxin [Amycolatopsis rhabdoformis]|uniref:Ferredoxin n=1 Tax=Amycolatopsis rhabdoformis TaxID=1448059 RepID=A0ABZ1IH92_9PSEU|nr:ferredoxin [Amycolatopsis rhabdoformis]WSE32914.1 ferredoxin [Amycolatopsis rhabdoformis]